MHKQNSWTNVLITTSGSASNDPKRPSGGESESESLAGGAFVSVSSIEPAPCLTQTPPPGYHHPYTTRGVRPVSSWAVPKSSDSIGGRRGRWCKNKCCLTLLAIFLSVFGLTAWTLVNTLYLGKSSSTSGTSRGVSKFGGHRNVHRIGGKDCLTPLCIKASYRLLSRHGSEFDPCVDFYGFACGKFVSESVIPDDSFTRSTLQEMQESILIDIKKMIEKVDDNAKNTTVAARKAKQLYNSCMHNNFRTSHYEDYKDLPIYHVLTLENVGNWPILQGSHWNESEYDLERLLAQLFAHQVQNIIEIYVMPDEANPTQYLLEFDKGKPAIEKSFFLNLSNGDYARYVRSYKRLLLESVLILSHGKQGSPKLVQDVDDIIDFETKLAKLVENSKCHYDGFDVFGGAEGYGRVELGDIQERIPQVNWTRMVQSLYENLGIAEHNVTSEMIVEFHCSEFFPGLLTLVADSDPRTVTNYLTWRFVFRYLPYLGNKFLQIWMEFMKDVPQSHATEERMFLSSPPAEPGNSMNSNFRWKQCASIVNDGFGMTMAHLYAKQRYTAKTEKTIKELIFYLKKAFKQIIHEQEWLAEGFKEELVEKLMKMGEKIGFPPYIMDEEALDKDYEGLDFADSSFLFNIIKMRKFEVRKEITKTQRRVDVDRDWYVQPLVANAFHSTSANEIVIPLGILRFPIFDEDYPMYLNFANLGVVLGHEMTHGFDHQGRHYDKDGNFSNWWPDDVLNAFVPQAICFADQYSHFKMPLVDRYVDGNETLADNVCDNAALRHSWLAYQMWAEDNKVTEIALPGLNFTVAQIFYMAFGQIWCEVLTKEGYQQYVRGTHSPGQFRAWGVAQNNIYFGEIFDCPVGSPMNPAKKCSLWS